MSMRFNPLFSTEFITEFRVTLSGPLYKNLKIIISIFFMISIGVWIIEDIYKSLGIRKVLTIATLPNKDRPLMFQIFKTF